MPIDVVGNQLSMETERMQLRVDGDCIRSLVNKITGEELISPAVGVPGISLVYRGGQEVPLVGGPLDAVRYIRVHDDCVMAVMSSWHGDAVIRFSLDRKTEQLVVEPFAYSGRAGVRAVRWSVPFRRELQLVAPFFQGTKLRLDDPLITGTHWEWPKQWEAGLAIVHQGPGGAYVYTQDTSFRYKSLQVGGGEEAGSLGFESESYGPIDDNLAAGGIAWRIDVYGGDWHEPAEAYRRWLYDAYGLDEIEKQIPSWVKDIRLALSWCPTDTKVLAALAARVPAESVLLHLHNWRTDPYDENYPTYTASEEGAAFIARAQEMGFHVMPHFNAVDMDPQHPVFHLVRDFVYQHVETGIREGWSWENGRMLGVPDSNKALVENRQRKVMVKIHPGLAMWRTILLEQIAQVVQQADLQAVFTDVTLCSQNLRNSLVGNLTSTEGMLRLLKEVGEIDGRTIVGGEGCNEIIAQGLRFAQSHLFRSFHGTIEGLERVHCDLGRRIYGGLCRLIGYSGLDGSTDESRLRLQAHAAQGAIPTITIHSAAEIENPNPAVAAILRNST